ncbi:hypothetical protein PG991_001494 [Apiospora marii]|uniref:Uncharacterized protein n=1 Tax=Apiospora marii TaxID=335849 RepID=A0ABR1SPZ2_9PEZI
MADLGGPLVKVIDRQKSVSELGIDAELVNHMYAENSKRLADYLWYRGEAWTVSAAWRDWQV